MSHAEKRRIGIIAEHLYSVHLNSSPVVLNSKLPRARLIFDQQFGRNRRMRPLTFVFKNIADATVARFLSSEMRP